MAAEHRHAYVYPTLRLLTLEQPDGLTRIYTARQCRHCARTEALTGQGTHQHQRGAALPPMETFWATPRIHEE